MMVKVIKIMPKLESWCNKNPAIKQKKRSIKIHKKCSNFSAFLVIVTINVIMR